MGEAGKARVTGTWHEAGYIKAAGNVVYTNFMNKKLFCAWEKEEAFLICLQNNLGSCKPAILQGLSCLKDVSLQVKLGDSCDFHDSVHGISLFTLGANLTLGQPR